MLGYSSTAANSSSSSSNEDHLQLQSPSVSASTPGSSRFDDVHSSGNSSHYSGSADQYNPSSTGAVSDAALSRFSSEQQQHSPRGPPPGGASPVPYGNSAVFTSPPRSRPQSRLQSPSAAAATAAVHAANGSSTSTNSGSGSSSSVYSAVRARTAGGVLSRYIWGQLADGNVQGALRAYQGVACSTASADAGIDPSSVLAALRPVYRAVVSCLLSSSFV
jgi:hypothetical protein